MNKKWRRVIFADEKRFNLDRPDGLHYYHRDLQKEQQLLSHQPMGDGGIVIRGRIGYCDKMEIKFITGK